MGLGVAEGALISAGIAAAASGGQAIAAGRLNKKNRQWQEQMYERQKSDNRQNWHDQNAYNQEMYKKYQSPEAMLRQYQEAGLNPYLLYGNGTQAQNVQSNQQAQGGSFQTPDQRNPLESLGHLGGSMQSAIQTVIQSRVANASIDNTEAKTLETIANTNVRIQELQDKVLDYHFKKETYPKQSTLIDKQIESSEQQIRNMQKTIEDLENQMKNRDASTEISREQLGVNKRNATTNERNAAINQQNANTNSMNAQTSRLMFNTTDERNKYLNRLTDAQASHEHGKRRLTQQQIITSFEQARLYMEQRGLTEAQQKQVMQKIVNMKEEKVLLEIQQHQGLTNLIKSIISPY